MTKKRVIIAEDDEEDRLAVLTAFQESRPDLKVDFANDGSDLMEILKKDAVAGSTLFVLLDLNMPKKDGRQALKEIKEDVGLKKIPVIIFTSSKNESEIRKCYELGANTYIVKPDRLEDLQKVIGNLSSYWMDTAAIPD